VESGGLVQRSNKIVLGDGGDTEFRETTEQRYVLGSHIYREPNVLVQSSL
jgi:hypothetical protein